jgi:gluconokinase
MTRSSLALGVDIGTGSIRAFLYTPEGRRFGSGARLPYEWRLTPDGGVEIEADALVELVAGAIDGALVTLPPDSPPIVAVGFSALWHTLVGLRADGSPVTPAYAWSDTRSTSAARRLRTQLDEHAVHARTGTMLHPSYPLARLAWLQETAPDLCANVASWMSVPEYVWYQLTGERAVDLSIAAGSGLLNQLTLQWDPELLAAAGIHAGQLSPLARGEARAVRPGSGTPAAERWKPLRGAVWRVPVGDGACANIGSGCTTADRMSLTVGTSAAARLLLPWPRGTEAPHGLWLYRMDEDYAVLGGAISNGGLVRQWLRRMLRVPDDDAQLDTRLAQREPAAHGLAMLPFLAGERSPDWPLDATALLAGLRLGTGALDILQAGLESVAYRIALLRQLLVTTVRDTPEIVASGAALERSPFWTQLVADVLGEPLLLSHEHEASSRGAAMLAFIAAQVTGSLAHVPAPDATLYEPDLRRHVVHSEALRRHLELARAIAPGGS